MRPLIIATIAFGASIAAADEYTHVEIIEPLRAIVDSTPSFMEGDFCTIAKIGDEMWVIASGYGVATEPGYAGKKGRRAAETIARLSCDAQIVEMLNGQTITESSFLQQQEITKDDVVTFASYFEKKTRSEVEGMIQGAQSGGSWRLQAGEERVFFKLRCLPLPVDPTDMGDSKDLGKEQNAASNLTAPTRAGDGDAAGGGEAVVVVVGVAGYMGNEAYSRREALENAISEAVRQALGQLIQGETLVDFGEVKIDRLYQAMPEGAVRHTILEEGPREDDTEYYVKIQATVSRAGLERGAEQVGLIASMVGKPKIAIIPYETMNGLPLKYDSSPVTTALNGIFVAAPYFLPTIDVRQVMTIKRTQQPALFKKYEAMMETPEAFDPLGFGELGIAADIIMKGEVFLLNKGKDSDGVLNKYSGTATLKLIWAGTGQYASPPDEHSVSVVAESPEAAMVQAVKKLKSRFAHMVDDMLDQWENLNKNGQEFTIAVTGIPGGRRGMQLERVIRNGLEALPKVKQVESGSAQDGFVNYSVTFLGTPAMFKELLVDWMLVDKGLEKYDFDPTNRGGSFTIDLTPLED